MARWVILLIGIFATTTAASITWDTGGNEFVREGGREGRQEEQQTQTYSYVLDNECTVNILHNISQSPEEQAFFFDAISLIISDARMVLPLTCRRSSLWLLCNLAFPCQSSDCSVTREDCEYAFQDCSEEAFNCSAFPDEADRREERQEEGEEGDDDWLTVEEAAQIPNPVTTCLADRGDSIPCCFEPFTQKEATGECVLACPSYPFGETRFKALTYTHFVLVWISTVLVVIALIPLFFLRSTLTFPKYAMPMALVINMFWLHNELWSVYVGFGEYVCGDEEDVIVAYEEFLESAVCFGQFYVFHFFGMMNLATIFAISAVFLSIFAFGESRDIRILEKPFLVFTFSAAFLFIFILVPLEETLDESNLEFGFAFSCVVPREGRGIFVFTYFTVLVGCNLLSWVFSLCLLIQKSKYLVLLHWRMFFYLAVQVVIQALFLGFVNGIVQDDAAAFTEEQERYATCVATQPRDENAGCEYDTSTGTYAYWCVYFFSLDLAFGGLAFVLYIIQPGHRQWWAALFRDKRAPKDLSDQSTVRLSHSNRSHISQLESKGS